MAGQLPHGTGDSRIEGQDSDFPEPGENPEHSGQRRQRSAVGSRRSAMKE
jgi:hypothetical protein